MLPSPQPRTAAALPRQPWHWRLREWVGAYLPLLLMAVLALGTWWLVRSTPVPEPPRELAPPSGEPDYTMERFLLQRFDADGRLRVRIEGQRLRHFVPGDTIEIDDVRVRALADDGSLTLASARQALTDGRGREVQLRGGAHVTYTPTDGSAPVEFHGEFLHAFVEAQQLRSDRPVTLTQGRNRIDAAGLEVDQRAQTVRLTGPLRATLEPQRLAR
ncbi:LPS export ABC transporter periplasmic protein LptC [Calidifontimicrobium sp. SYSU G02091]|uniref:LPS export ABC transporter periplasmic protein LptC n=1 Tax=Calidifontimicrobium sp. SYSU G02091 TaxID=2926421 RepID=UPI001F53CBEC|nr:LPS export ABC transporter periplasmic protein LptC [Calidifontimicrobium sp. SYSU G02091]MCI1191639.1 LPS export ABC transporter periplasmic protein LptC [Calidifontimicrobium sp. SYSU G02091]